MDKYRALGRIPSEPPHPSELPGVDYLIDKTSESFRELVNDIREYFRATWEYFSPQSQQEIREAITELERLARKNARSRKEMGEILSEAYEIIVVRLRSYAPYEVYDKWEYRIASMKEFLYGPTPRQRYAGAYAAYMRRYGGS